MAKSVNDNGRDGALKVALAKSVDVVRGARAKAAEANRTAAELAALNGNKPGKFRFGAYVVTLNHWPRKRADKQWTVTVDDVATGVEVVE